MAYFPTIPDETAFTAGASPVTPIAGVFDDSLGAVISGESGSLRITEKRAAHVNLRSETGTELATAAAPLRVDPTGTTKQPVTLFDSAGTAITLLSGRLLVDGSGVTQPISAASLPLPTGASTAAKQPAIGTAGTPSADVISVQGVSGGTAQPISGTVADSTLAAIITGGKAAVSLASLPITQVSADDLAKPFYIARSYAEININTAGVTTIFTAAAATFYYITAIQFVFSVNATAGGTVFYVIQDSVDGVIWVGSCFFPTSSGLPTTATNVSQATPPGFFYHSKTAASILQLNLNAPTSFAAAIGNIYYGFTTVAG